jgi:uncharacterized hydrophobic protein (TIGR00271 family)
MAEASNSTPNAEQKSNQAFNEKVLRMLVALRDFARSTMFLGDDMDQEGTIEIIKKDMVFRGYVVWILICSIFIASIGLNLNSTAVIIGAMLISPLMAPILAIGLSVGTNDWHTLKRALKNFGVMVVVALMTSTLYFLITPLQEAQPELLSRTSPTFLDALIAIFGGLAGIIGISRSSRGNVIPGVAIASLVYCGLRVSKWAMVFLFRCVLFIHSKLNIYCWGHVYNCSLSQVSFGQFCEFRYGEKSKTIHASLCNRCDFAERLDFLRVGERNHLSWTG